MLKLKMAEKTYCLFELRLNVDQNALQTSCKFYPAPSNVQTYDTKMNLQF